MDNVIPQGRALDWELFQILWPEMKITRDGDEFWYNGDIGKVMIDFQPSTCDPNSIYSLISYINKNSLKNKFKVCLQQEAKKDNIELKDEIDFMLYARESFVVRAAYYSIIKMDYKGV